jgi:hypothetical protein
MQMIYKLRIGKAKQYCYMKVAGGKRFPHQIGMLSTFRNISAAIGNVRPFPSGHVFLVVNEKWQSFFATGLPGTIRRSTRG